MPMPPRNADLPVNGASGPTAHGARRQPAFLALSLVSLLAMACGDKTDGTGDTAGSDDTGATSLQYDDADEDTILDIHEGTEDPDGDDLPNMEDVDSDGDTIGDRLEAGDGDPLTLPVDSDGDGTPDYLDLDSDNNCISDSNEKRPTGDGPVDTDGDGDRDYRDDDNDGDGIKDIYELDMDTCAEVDSDGDGTADYMDDDSDGDGIGDQFEAGTTEWEDEPVDTDGDGVYDYLDDDSDGDGFSDTEESGVTSTEEAPRDMDDDGTPDFQDTDADGDSLSDADERDIYGTDPFDSDTDGDGFSDGGEITAGTDPLDSSSVVDGIYVEVPERTNIEELFEFTLQIQMGDVAFLIDTTGSMGSTANAMASEFSSIVTTLTSAIPDAEYGVGTYDDYACCGYGYPSSGDKPFIMRQQITDDVTRVQYVLSNDVALHYGGDGPESSMEAIYQGASGEGYDMNCDGSYDSSTDVLPFLSSSSDPYGGAGGQGYSSSYTGGGANGGFGFRDYALPVIVFATDYDLRDPDNGYPSPGGCFQDAGQTDVVAALSDLGGYVIGVQANNYTSTPYNQMVQLAQASGSYADTDGDGVSDDPLAFRWTGSSSSFRTTITSAIEDLVSSIKFSQVSLTVDGDDWGFVTGIDPEYFEDIDPNAGAQVIDFVLTFRGVVAATTEDQLFRLTLSVIGDGTVLLDTLDIIVLVPGNAY
jgi:hypothetical protein